MAVAGKNSDLETTDVAAPSRGLCRAECNTVKRRGALKNVQASRGVATSNVTLLSNRCAASCVPSPYSTKRSPLCVPTALPTMIQLDYPKPCNARPNLHHIGSPNLRRE
ncbi:hypothetical protein M8818_002501 [Zalaria obscura]|uniref:Uncharacterized protein n=1 Tax=Zalaria obscura TaxID=2024903 RepID=A0ACC3SG37_9PEZI